MACAVDNAGIHSKRRRAHDAVRPTLEAGNGGSHMMHRMYSYSEVGDALWRSRRSSTSIHSRMRPLSTYTRLLPKFYNSAFASETLQYTPAFPWVSTPST